MSEAASFLRLVTQINSFRIEAKRTRVPLETMYHGTSDVNLHSILKNGLVINPKNVVWENDDSASVYQSSNRTYGGVYLTKNLYTASSAASNAVRKLGGNRLIVIVQFQPQSSILDEDLYKSTVERAIIPQTGNEPMLGIVYTSIYKYLHKIHSPYSNQGTSGKSLLKQILREFYASMKRYLEINLSDIELKEKGKIFVNLIMATLRRKLAYLDDYYYNSYILYANFLNEQGRYDESLVPNELRQKPSKSEAEHDYMKALDRFIVLTRKATVNRDHFTFNVRSLEPITYSGRNKILAILGLAKYTSGDDNSIKLYYGQIPEEFWDQYKSIGPKPDIIDMRRR